MVLDEYAGSRMASYTPSAKREAISLARPPVIPGARLLRTSLGFPACRLPLEGDSLIPKRAWTPSYATRSLREALEEVPQLVESGQRLRRGALSRFIALLRDHQ